MKCVVCGSADVEELLDIAGVPVFCNQVCQTSEEARSVPRANMQLLGCAECGHVFNAKFDPALVEYSPDYENSLHFSAKFESFADEIVAKLDSRWSLRGKTIVEVGCGRGDFLKKLCSHEGTRGFGFDKSYPGTENDETRKDNVLIRAEHYTSNHAELRPALLCCRHVLEHVDTPVEFLASLRDVASVSSNSDVAVYFEVPNGEYMLDDGSIWDVLYEHCGYFTPASMKRAFSLAGYATERLESSFARQFLSLYGSTRGDAAAPPRSDAAATPGASFHSFAEKYAREVEEQSRWLDEARSRGQRVVVWGAGTKGTMYLNTLDDAASDLVRYIVDINPRKWGKFVPGSGQQIVSPDTLDEYRPDCVVLMNPAYRNEIEGSLTARGIEATVRQA